MANLWRRPVVAVLAGALAAAIAVASCGGGEEAPTARPAPTTAPQPTAAAPTATPTPQTRPAATATAAPLPTATPTPAPTPTPTGVQPRTGGILKWAMSRDPTDLDLHRARSSANWMTMGPALNGLLLLYADGSPRPDLAQSWTTSGDGKTLTFNLAKNAKWHDGRPVTADDVVYSFERIAFSKEPAMSAPPYRTSVEVMTKVERVDDSTVRMTLKRSSASFFSNLTLIGNMVYPRHKPIADYAKRTPETVVGSGPFKFKEHVASVRVNLVKNPDYFKKDEAGRLLPYLDGIDLFIIADPATEYASFRTARTEIIFPFAQDALQGKQKQLAQDVPGATLLIGPGPAAAVYFRTGVKPWDDVRVRRAMHLAMDRQFYLDSWAQGLGSPYRMLSVPGTVYATPDSELRALPGYNPATKKQDIEEAKRLIREAGLDLKDPGLANATVPVRNIYSGFAQVIQEIYRQAFGWEWKLDVMDPNRTLQVQAEGRFALYVSQTGAALPDPSQVLDAFVRTGSGLNYGKWSDPAVDTKLDEIDATLDDTRRGQIARALEKELLLDKVWYVVAGSNPTFYAWRPSVKGFWVPDSTQTNGFLHTESAWLERT